VTCTKIGSSYKLQDLAKLLLRYEFRRVPLRDGFKSESGRDYHKVNRRADQERSISCVAARMNPWFPTHLSMQGFIRLRLGIIRALGDRWWWRNDSAQSLIGALA